MPDPIRFLDAPPVTPQLLEQSRRQQTEAAEYSLLVGLAPAAGVVALAPLIPAAAQRASSLWSGVHFEPRPGGTVSPRIGATAVALYALPIPAGVVPPEVYGIDPSLVPHTVGNFRGTQFLGLKAEAAREAAYNANQREVLILAYLKAGAGGQALGDISTEKLIADRNFLRATVHQQGASDRAQAILERRVADRLADQNPITSTAPTTSTQPTLPPLLGAGSGVGTPLIPSPNGVPAGAGISGLPIFGFGNLSLPDTLAPLIPKPLADLNADKVEPSNTRQQEAKQRAPKLLQGILSESADP